MRGSASARCQQSDTATARENAPRLSVSLVGRFAIRLNGRPIELRTHKAAAVLGYLALSESKHESRERLVGLLWSRSDEEKARASLRQVVRELRSVLEEAGYRRLRRRAVHDPSRYRAGRSRYRERDAAGRRTAGSSVAARYAAA